MWKRNKYRVSGGRLLLNELYTRCFSCRSQLRPCPSPAQLRWRPCGAMRGVVSTSSACETSPVMSRPQPSGAKLNGCRSPPQFLLCGALNSVSEGRERGRRACWFGISSSVSLLCLVGTWRVRPRSMDILFVASNLCPRSLFHRLFILRGRWVAFGVCPRLSALPAHCPFALARRPRPL